MAEFTKGQILKDPEVIGTGTSGALIKFLDGADVNSVTIKSPNTLAVSYTLTLPPNDGDNLQVLQTDGTGNLVWTTVTAPASGANTQVQYNNNGALAGHSGLTYNSGSGTLTATFFAGNGSALTNVKANGHKITVGTTQPTAPTLYDLWIDTN